MKQLHASLNLLLASSLVAAALAMAGLSASAQTAPTGTTTSTPTTSAALRTKPKPTTATDLMVQEACQRQKARTAKFLQSGVPEKFGSEEPFVFDPNAPRC